MLELTGPDFEFVDWGFDLEWDCILISCPRYWTSLYGVWMRKAGVADGRVDAVDIFWGVSGCLGLRCTIT